MASAENTLGFTYSLDGAAVNYGGDAGALMQRMMNRVTKLLKKKGIALSQQAAGEVVPLRVRVVQIEQGNQLMRYFLPFLSPAFVEIEAELDVPSGGSESFFYKKAAQFGLFGGSASGMLGVCVDRVATDLSKDINKRLK